VKKFFNELGKPTKISVIIVLLFSLFTIPNTFIFHYEQSAGHLYGQYRQAIGQSNSQLAISENSEYQIRILAKQEGFKSGIFLIFGEHLPFTVFALIAIGLISKTTTVLLKRKLVLLYVLVAALAIIFFAIGGIYRLPNDYNFSTRVISTMYI